MSNLASQPLQQAYQYIKDKQYFEARAILLPIVQAEPENADAWWLLANAQTDPNASRDALNIVLKLKPENANARAMLERIDARYPQPNATSVETTTADSTNPFDDLPDPFSVPSTPSAAASAKAPINPNAPASLDDLLSSMGKPGATSASSSTPSGTTTSTSGNMPVYTVPRVSNTPITTQSPARGRNRTLYILLGVATTLVCLCLACVGVFVFSAGRLVSDPTFQAAIGTGLAVFQLPDQLPLNAQRKGLISTDNSVDGTIQQSTYYTYTYEANESETITVKLTPHNSSSNSGALVGLYDKDGKKVAGSGLFDSISTQASSKQSGQSLNTLQSFTYKFKTGGNYTILVGGIGKSTDYTLSISSDK